MDPNMLCNLLLQWHLCVLTLVTRKLHIIYRQVFIKTWPLSCCCYFHGEWLLHCWRFLFSVLELDVRYDWWVMAPTLLAVSFWSAIWASLHAQLENYWLYRDVQHTEWLLYYWRHSLCSSEFQERFNWRFMALDMHRLFSDTNFCVSCKPLYTCTSLFGAQQCLTTKLMHVMTAYQWGL